MPMTAPSLIAPRKLRSPLKWHGGKSYLARRIIALFPPHEVYCEPFVGGGSILLNKIPAAREVAGDMNPDLMRFWRMFQDRGVDWTSILATSPYSKTTFDQACEPPRWAVNPIGNARDFLIRNRMSRGGLGRDFAWSDRLRGKRREGGPVPGDVNAWETFVAEKQGVIDRIRGVRFFTWDAMETIIRFGRSNALVYCDPPYLMETRSAHNTYAVEATPRPTSKSASARADRLEADRAWHRALLNLLLARPAKVAISGYRSPLYDSMLAGWRRVEFDMPNHSGQGATKQRRIECVWMNY